jgi:hypothetical protein
VKGADDLAQLAKFEPERRLATLAAMVIETTATVIDEVIDLHDRALIAVFNRVKHKHQSEFARSGKAINEKVRFYWRIGNALMQAKQSGADPFAAIESVLPWEAFIASVTEAAKLGQSEEFDIASLVSSKRATFDVTCDATTASSGIPFRSASCWTNRPSEPERKRQRAAPPTFAYAGTASRGCVKASLRASRI